MRTNIVNMPLEGRHRPRVPAFRHSIRYAFAVIVLFSVIVANSSISFVHSQTVGSGNPLLMGWYTNSPSAANTANLSTYAAQGATAMLPYNCYFDQAGTAAYLTAAQSKGIKVWVDLRLHVFGSSLPSQANWQAFINKFKGYESVLGWYIADEPEYSGPSYSVIAQYYNWTKQVDPVHPVSIAHCWNVKSAFAGPPRPYDVLLLDVYPGWGYYDDLNEFNILVRDSYKWWLQGKNAANGYGVPIEAVALGFGYLPGTTTTQSHVRDLTDAEHKWHTYTAVALGYEGVIYWWDVNQSGMVQTNPWMKSLVAKRFTEVSQIADEMAVGTTNAGLSAVSVANTKLIYRYGFNSSSNEGAIVAVNISRYNATDNAGEALPSVTMTLPSGISASQVTVVGENRTIPVTNGSFTDNFGSFAVHIYKFTTGSTQLTSPQNLRVVGVS